MVQALAALSRHDLNLLFVQDDAVKQRISGAEGPIGLTVLCENLIEEPGFSGSIVEHTNRPECDDARKDQRGVARERLATMHGAHFGHLHAHARIMVDVPHEVPAVIPGMQVEAVAAFVYVDQRQDIGPPSWIYRADVGDLLQLEEFSCIDIGHEPLAPVHVAAGIRWRRARVSVIGVRSRIAHVWPPLGIGSLRFYR